jgi:hypothetical protein
VHRSGAFVDRLVPPHGIEQGVQRFLRQGDVVAQPDLVDFFHEIAEHRTLAATRSDGALAHFLVEIVKAAAGGHRHRTGFPVDLHRCDLVD